MDRLYALVEELRAVAPRGLSSRRLAERFEVSVRTIERDLDALRQAGLPISARQGRNGGYALDKAMTLPPLNFTPGEAVAVAVALSGARGTPFARDAHSALRKIIAVMPGAAAREAHGLAETVRLLVPAGEPLDAGVAQEIREAVRRQRVVRIEYADVRGEKTIREVEAQLLVAGPRGWYLTGWCRLRRDTRAFRLDRVLSAMLTPEPVPRPRAVPDPSVPELRTLTPHLE
ncbi:helix-turn-helix transcriptional regulator [Streptosporangium sp. CA-115845]|uniref:helix-turn-helix transcriptional regulator n=1 Tax=Streptosporangium sp. CA-115845 TaxID=3240071 RepID=UPI003D8F15C7